MRRRPMARAPTFSLFQRTVPLGGDPRRDAVVQWNCHSKGACHAPHDCFAGCEMSGSQVLKHLLVKSGGLVVSRGGPAALTGGPPRPTIKNCRAEGWGVSILRQQRGHVLLRATEWRAS